MQSEPVRPPPGVWHEHRPDGFVVGASTRASWFVVMYMSIWVFAWVGLLAGFTDAALRSPGVGARVMLTVLWLVVGVQVYGWMMILFGRYVLTVRGDRAALVLAVGPLRWRRRFAWSDITSVGWRRSPRKGAPAWILLSGRRRPISFGSVIRTDRRMYVYQVLEQELDQR